MYQNNRGQKATPFNSKKTVFTNRAFIGLLCLCLGVPFVPAAAVQTPMEASPGTIRYVDDDAVGSNDGSDWQNAFRYLQDALAAAQYGDEIRAAQGVYRPDRSTAYPGGTGQRVSSFTIETRIKLIGGFAGGGAPDPNARDIEAYKSVLTGDLLGNDSPMYEEHGFWDDPNRLDNCFHVITAIDADETSIDGFYIEGGNAVDEPEAYTPQSMGGGIYNIGSDFRVGYCTFQYNVAGNWGSAVYNENALLEIANCRFRYNDDCGWPEDAHAAMDNIDCNVHIAQCEFAGNFVYAIGNDGDLNHVSVIEDCRFQRNRGIWLGAISNYQVNMIIKNCSFIDNSGRATGAIDNRRCSPQISNCIFAGNFSEEASLGSGATTSALDSTAHYRNCTFFANCGEPLMGEDPTAANCIFYQNFIGTDVESDIGDYEFVDGPSAPYNFNGNPSFVNASGFPDVVRYLSGPVGYTEVFPDISTSPNRRAVPYVIDRDGWITGIRIYHEGGSGHLLGAVYADDGTGRPGAMLDCSAFPILVNPLAGWQMISLRPNVYAGQTVWLAWVFENNPGVRYRRGLPARASSSQGWEGGMPENFGPSEMSDFIYSVYAVCHTTSKYGCDTLGNTELFADIAEDATRRAVPYTLEFDATVKSIAFHHGPASGEFILAIYDDNGSGLPGSRLASVSGTVSSAAGWQTVPLSEPLFMNAGPLWVAWVFENVPGLRYKSGTPGRADSGQGWAGGMPADFGPATTAGYIYSVYLNYEFGDTTRPADCHLKSEYGRWDPLAQAWVQDDVTSPCIDGGDPADINWIYELWPHGGRINMGYYGGTPQASLSPSTAGNPADIDRDDTVSADDLLRLAGKWLQEYLLCPEDLTLDGKINLEDFAVFSENWLLI